jgi:hypothetical protein
MKFLVFATYRSAYSANAIISLNMRLSGDCTVQYANVRERSDGKFVIPAPVTIGEDGNEVMDAALMEYVANYSVEEYNSAWFVDDAG